MRPDKLGQVQSINGMHHVVGSDYVHGARSCVNRPSGSGYLLLLLEVLLVRLHGIVQTGLQFWRYVRVASTPQLVVFAVNSIGYAFVEPYFSRQVFWRLPLRIGDY